MVFQHHLKCLIFSYEFLAGILSYSLPNTNTLMLNFFGKQPALERPIFKSNPFPYLAELENNRKRQMG